MVALFSWWVFCFVDTLYHMLLCFLLDFTDLCQNLANSPRFFWFLSDGVFDLWCIYYGHLTKKKLQKYKVHPWIKLTREMFRSTNTNWTHASRLKPSPNFAEVLNSAKDKQNNASNCQFSFFSMNNLMKQKVTSTERKGHPSPPLSIHDGQAPFKRFSWNPSVWCGAHDDLKRARVTLEK